MTFSGNPRAECDYVVCSGKTTVSALVHAGRWPACGAWQCEGQKAVVGSPRPPSYVRYTAGMPSSKERALASFRLCADDFELETLEWRHTQVASMILRWKHSYGGVFKGSPLPYKPWHGYKAVERLCGSGHTTAGQRLCGLC